MFLIDVLLEIQEEGLNLLQIQNQLFITRVKKYLKFQAKQKINMAKLYVAWRIYKPSLTMY